MLLLRDGRTIDRLRSSKEIIKKLHWNSGRVLSNMHLWDVLTTKLNRGE